MSLSLKPSGIVSIGELMIPDAGPGEVALIVSVGDRHAGIIANAALMQDPARNEDVWQRYFLPALAALRHAGAFEAP